MPIEHAHHAGHIRTWFALGEVYQTRYLYRAQPEERHALGISLIP